MRLLGARGRAELATPDPANRLPGVRSITWTLNPRGFGGSGGRATIGDYCRSAIDGYDALASRYPDAHFMVYGKSIGGTAALYLGAQRSVDALVVKNAIDVRAVTARRLRRWFPGALVNSICNTLPPEMHAAIWATQCRCPALFVVSANDRLAHPQSQEAIAACYGGAARTLTVAGNHDDHKLDANDEVPYGSAIRELWEGAEVGIPDTERN